MPKKKGDVKKGRDFKKGEKRSFGHGLQRNYKCGMCTMAYHNDYDLRLHMRNWHGIRDDQK